jgi:hypothetical protein
MGFEMLELYEAKVSCTVLRGEKRSNPPDLPDDIYGIDLCTILKRKFYTERSCILS